MPASLLLAVQVAAMSFTSAAHVTIAYRAVARARPIRGHGGPGVSALLATGAVLWGTYAHATGSVPLLITSATTFAIHAGAIAGGAARAAARTSADRGRPVVDVARAILSTDSESSLPQLPPPPSPI